VLKIAYLANQFPSVVEPYVMEEIDELRTRGIEICAASARLPQPDVPQDLQKWIGQTIYLQKIRLRTLLRGMWVCARQSRKLRPFLGRVLFRGRESALQRAKALVHTLLGACYAVLLKDRGISHIHVHHGYFSAWIAMVAARLLGISYSVTLHGSDLLLNAAYLDTKLDQCSACFTVSEFNRQFILRQFPRVAGDKVSLRRLGVEVASYGPRTVLRTDWRFTMLAVGRLHPVKDHAFLLSACALLKARKVQFACLIAGDGPERSKLENLVASLGLESEVALLGHVPHCHLASLFPLVDLVVLTSRSEGIPLALMEAMTHSTPVLAPRITGIPELVIDGRTGFLYHPGSIHDFVARVELVKDSIRALGPLRRSARQWVSIHFNRSSNTHIFSDTLLQRLAHEAAHADPVLQ
jgi:glycosyltransferase involved in cell wall biosynthesis